MSDGIGLAVLILLMWLIFAPEMIGEKAAIVVGAFERTLTEGETR